MSGPIVVYPSRASERALAASRTARLARAYWDWAPILAADAAAVFVPEGHDGDDPRAPILGRYDVSLGAGPGRLAGRVFRIGDLGDLNDVSLAGAPAGVEMGLAGAGIPFEPGGVQAATDHLSASAASSQEAAVR